MVRENEQEKKKLKNLKKEYEKIHYLLYAPEYFDGRPRSQPTKKERKKLITRLEYLQGEIFNMTNTLIKIVY